MNTVGDAKGPHQCGLAVASLAACSARMTVSFTTKEFARLLELMHLGLTVAGAQADDPATMPKRYDELTQKVLRMAEVFGCAELVEADVNGEFFFNERVTEGPAAGELDRFTEDLFWGELVARLAARDLRAEIGAAAEAEELAPEHEAKMAEMQDAYWREFEQNGVDHLVLLRGGRG